MERQGYEERAELLRQQIFRLLAAEERRGTLAKDRANAVSAANASRDARVAARRAQAAREARRQAVKSAKFRQGLENERALREAFLHAIEAKREAVIAERAAMKATAAGSVVAERNEVAAGFESMHKLLVRLTDRVAAEREARAQAELASREAARAFRREVKESRERELEAQLERLLSALDARHARVAAVQDPAAAARVMSIIDS